MYVKQLLKNKRGLAVLGIIVPLILAVSIIYGDNVLSIFKSRQIADPAPSVSLPIAENIRFKFNPNKREVISFIDKQIELPAKLGKPEENFPLKAKLTNQAQGLEVPVETSIQKLNRNEYLVTLSSATPNQVAPGSYVLELEYTENSQKHIYKQDFAWGVLVINTNKPVYKPGEHADISIGVLDQNGSMVCDAELTLKVTSPKKVPSFFSTKDGSIKVNPGCHLKEMILEPDFEAEIATQIEGTYRLDLTAITKNGAYAVSDSFLVSNNIPFDIERITATRIYPKANYPVVIAIKANENYAGSITESIPNEYEISGLSEEEIEKITGKKMEGDLLKGLSTENNENTTILKWEVNWQKGKTYYIGYEYDAPNRSPDFHLLGPLHIGDFKEARQWQIAVDDLEIIDVHSSPEEGEEWIVRFETNGNHDLSIIPNDQATIEDDEFTSLSCDGEERVPQILPGDIIYYPNWECDGVGKVIHKTLRAGNHTLRFEYGGEVDYAYNAIWKVGWDYRKSLTITGSTTGAQTDYVMRVRTYYASGTDTSDQVYCAGNCKSDFGDIRFTSSDGTTDLSYWRQTYTDGTSAAFWVEVASIPASPSTTNVYMYYGNSSTSTTSSGENTFLFFDDFSGDLSKWTIDPENTDNMIYIYSSAGNPSPSARHNPDSSQTKNAYFDTRMVTSSYNTFQDGIMEYDVYLAGAARIIHQLGWRVPSNSLGSGYCWRLQNSAADGGHLEFTGIASWSPFGTSYPATTGSVWHSVKEIVNGTTYTASVDGGSNYSGTDATTTGANRLVSHVHGVSLTGESYVLVDNVRTRKYANPEPTYTSWGSQETPLIDITGTAYTDDDEASTLNGVDVCAAVDSTFTVGDCDTTSSGVFDIQDVAVTGKGNQQITLFVDGGTYLGNVVTKNKAAGSSLDDITNLKLYQNHALLRYETGDYLSIVDMDTYDDDQNSTDMLFDATDSSPDTLTWEPGIELYVPSGKTFAPGGNLNGHDIEIDGTWTAASAETMDIDGTFKLDPSGVFNSSTATLTFDGTGGTEDIITDGSGSLYNLIINDNGGSLTVEVEDALDVDNNLIITGGTLDAKSGENNQITVGGNWSNDDIFEARNGTVVFDGATNTNLDSNCANESTCTNEDFYNLTINKAEDAQVTLANNHLRVTNMLKIVVGWLIQGALNIRAEGATAVDLDDFGRWQNISTGDITLGGDIINDGNITLNANGMSCGDADDITISSTSSSPRSWGGAGGFRITDVSVSYQTGSAIVYASSSTNLGNMGANWRFTQCNEFHFGGLNFDSVQVD